MMQLTEQQRQVVRDLLAQAKAIGAAAEVSVSLDQGLSIEVRHGDVDTLEHQSGQAIAFSLYHKQRVAHTSASCVTADTAKQLFDKAKTIAEYAQADPYSGLAPAQLMVDAPVDLQLHIPWQLSPQQAIDRAIQCEAVALKSDPRVDQIEAVSASHFNAYHAYANTHGIEVGYPTSLHSMHCSVIAKDDAGMQRDFEYTQSRDLSQLVSVEALARDAVAQSVNRLGARQIKTGQYPVVLHHRVAKSLLGHFIGAISGARLYQRSSFLCDRIGEKLFADSVSIQQQPHLLHGIGSAAFDDDGVTTKNLAFVDHGVLSSYALSHYSAQRLGMQTTGNAGGVHNCSLVMPTMAYSDLLKQMDTGLLITDVMGQGVNLVTGDYSRGASGYWVENGEVQYAVEEITIASTLPDMFLGIQAMADDIDCRGNVRSGSLLVDRMQVAGQ